MWNLRNETDQHGGKRERQTIKETLNGRKQTEGCWRGGGQREWVKWVMGIKEGTCGEHWVLYVSDESLNSTCKTNITLYVN